MFELGKILVIASVLGSNKSNSRRSSVSLVIMLEVTGISNCIRVLYAEVGSASAADGSGIEYYASL